jgi:chromosome segregation ATPase
MKIRAPLIFFVEEALSKNQKAVAALLDEMSSVKEGMRMYHSNLAGYIHEYKVMDGQSTKINCDLGKLEEKIKKIKNSIHEDTIILKTLEAEMKDLEKIYLC